ncbi:MAG: glycosyltransferase family 4 protein [Flavisolibacter sp.]|nr:glycosyltransferase family 4 protein [Flavisolibacter sp.]
MLEKRRDFELFSMYDGQHDLIDKYIPPVAFRAYSGNRLKFIKEAISIGRQCETIVLGHINLLLVGFLIKLLSPKTRLILIAHGIEVWKPLPFWKVRMLQKVDLVLPVSEFTKQKMQSLFHLKNNQLKVLNNCLDPFLEKKLKPATITDLRSRYGFSEDDTILFTLTRLKSSEQYKGYDRVITALPAILKKYPKTRYLIAGKYDDSEKERLDVLINDLGLQGHVTLTGFLAEEETEAYFTMADIYIMPSTGEGFGIVFIEALFYGKPVIAGNVDGSVDALDGGTFGLLINPLNNEEIVGALFKLLTDITSYLPNDTAVLSKFGFPTYQSNLRKILN